MVEVHILEIEEIPLPENRTLLRVSYKIKDEDFESPVAFFTVPEEEAKEGGIEKKVREIVEEYRKHKTRVIRL